MSSRPRVSRRLLVLALTLTTAASATAAPPAVRGLTRWDASAVERAVAGASRRLEDPRCQTVLDDFEVGGRTLRAALEEWGTSPAGYLRLVPFLDGSERPLCRHGNVALVTEVGGRTLRAALEEWGTSPAGYLRLVPFLDGSERPLCRHGNVALVTEVGVRRVFVCTAVFSAHQLRNPGVAESMIIHEMLHTLGLGENPPSSIEITQRVESRCR
jgi:hypothetical protein